MSPILDIPGGYSGFTTPARGAAHDKAPEDVRSSRFFKGWWGKTDQGRTSERAQIFNRGTEFVAPPGPDDRNTGIFGRWSPTRWFQSVLSAEDVPDTATSCCPALTWVERLYGFCICFLAGVLVSAMAFNSFSQVLLGNPTRFAVAYTTGNILSLCATAFLVGATRQLRSMLDPERLTATLLYLCSLALTLFSVFYLQIGPLIVLFVAVQWIALIWYSLSYIPYGQSVALRMVSSVV